MSSLPPPRPSGKKPNTKLLVVGGVAAAGIVYWAYKKNSASASTATTDPSIDPTTDLPYSSEYYGSDSSAVGTMPSAYGYTDPYGNTIVPGTSGGAVIAPSTNPEWAQQAASMLVNSAQYDAGTAYGTLGLFVGTGGNITLSDSQYAIVEAAYGLLGPPPQPITAPHKASPSGQNTGSVTAGKHHYVTQIHQISVATSARDLVQRFSDSSVATPNNIQSALTQTVGDPRNARYVPYYGSHKGMFPAKAKIYVHVVKAG